MSGVLLHNLGIVLDRQHKWDEAERMLRYCYDLSVKLETQQAQAMILNSLGQLIQKQGKDRFQLALMYFRASVKLGEQLNDQRHLAKVHTAIGSSFLEYGQIEEAIEELRQGFEIDERLMNGFGLTKVTWRLTNAFLKANKRDLAVTYCHRALAVFPTSQKLQVLFDNLSSPQHTVSYNSYTFIRGTVKLIRRDTHSNTRWGYITSDVDGSDVYFREGFINSECISQLEEGTSVEVNVKQNPKGPCASSIKII